MSGSTGKCLQISFFQTNNYSVLKDTATTGYNWISLHHKSIVIWFWNICLTLNWWDTTSQQILNRDNTTQTDAHFMSWWQKVPSKYKHFWLCWICVWVWECDVNGLIKIFHQSTEPSSCSNTPWQTSFFSVSCSNYQCPEFILVNTMTVCLLIIKIFTDPRS